MREIGIQQPQLLSSIKLTLKLQTRTSLYTKYSALLITLRRHLAFGDCFKKTSSPKTIVDCFKKQFSPKNKSRPLCGLVQSSPVFAVRAGQRTPEWTGVGPDCETVPKSSAGLDWTVLGKD